MTYEQLSDCRPFRAEEYYGRGCIVPKNILLAPRHSAGSVLQFPIQLFIWPQSGSIEINNMRATLVWVFFAYKKILGRTETRTRDRMYLGRIRSVRDISRGDRARIATCSLQTPTDLRQIIV